MPPLPLVILVGPTGSGKSDLSLRIAERFPAEVVNCDSLQVYRGLDVGTAKLSPAERRGVPHHLIDIVEPWEPFTAGEYARRARPLLRDIAARRRLPIVVGGTGFYLRALRDGLFDSPAPQKPDAQPDRDALAARERRRPGSLHRILRRLDSATAARIHPNDAQKLVRAVHVCLAARQPMSRLQSAGRDPLTGFASLTLGLDPPRDALRLRLDARCAAMFQRGLLDEVRGLLARGVPPDAKPLASLGYAQAMQVIRDETGLPRAVTEAQARTRQYAKRQMTWFRREPHVRWLHGFGDDPALVAQALTLVGDHARTFSDFSGTAAEQIAQ